MAQQIAPITLKRWHHEFEAVLPRIERHAKVAFRQHVRNPEKLEESIQEVRAMAWKYYLDLKLKGKNPDSFISAIATYCAKQVQDGRHLTGQEKAKDVMSPRAQRIKGFSVQPLPRYETGVDDNEAIDALADNRQALPSDQAAFRIDTPEWLSRLGPVKRPIVEDMMQEFTTTELAEKHKKSYGRISQLRREAMDDYAKFHGELETAKGR